MFLGSAVVSPSNGNETFVFTLPAQGVEPGSAFTATARDEYSYATSEFSECFTTPLVPSVCGDASSDEEITAADALLTLRTAVGGGSCALCHCDANDSGDVSATDALQVLRAAVGQAVSLTCPAFA